MLFHSFEFLFLLGITLILFYLMPSKRLALLAVANLVFYGVAGLGYLLIFVGVAYVTYFCAKKQVGPRARPYYWAGLAVNFANLAFFKYTGFVLGNLEGLLGIHFPWQDSLLAAIILPVGISFYTFQLVAYLIDVKRKDIAPCFSFMQFWVFIGFFAQLIAGPIMRGKEFLPQIEGLDHVVYHKENFQEGFYYILMGMTKKLMFSDILAGKVESYFVQASQLSTLDVWIAAYLFAFQIYFDFSSYSEIAMGIGKLFGLEMALNFRTPYLSKNPPEFWKRWHITLSSWIRDYLYIPMGGGKKGFGLQCVFLITAMALSGLWHGAAWNFVLWGIYHGLLSVLHKVYRRLIKDKKIPLLKGRFYQYFSVLVFFQLTVIGWVFFRAANLGDALQMIKVMLNPAYLVFKPNYGLYFLLIVLLYLLHGLESWVRSNGTKLMAIWHTRFPEPVRAAAYALAIVILLLFTQREQSSFIYFQF